MSQDKKEDTKKSEPINSLKVGEYTFNDLGKTAVVELEHKEPALAKRKLGQQ